MDEQKMGMDDGVIRWPMMSEPFAQALRLAVADVLASYTPLGIVAAGSILGGQGGPTSDIDLYVIHHAAFRQRLQRRYVGVPCEVFINPPQQVRRYFVEEHASGRPITAHMLATGFVVFEADPVVQTLRNEAASWLATPPHFSEEDLLWRRYMIVDLLDNARDLIGVDEEMAQFILAQALYQLVEVRFLSANRFLPRLKATLNELETLDPAAAIQARAILAAPDINAALTMTSALAQALIGESSFFEWDSAQETVA